MIPLSDTLGKGVSVEIGDWVGRLVGNGFAGMQADINNANTKVVQKYLLILNGNIANIVMYPFQCLLIFFQPFS
jgi:hypothetical protein